jgi:HlyD family secretion protein
MRIIIGVLILIVCIGGSGFWYWKTHSSPRTTFTFAEVHRGRLEATVGSTGTLQPRELVDVGAQVVGRIIYIGKDANTKSGIVDWGSKVEGPPRDVDGNIAKDKDGKPRLGTVLAQIDPLLYEAQRDSAAASLKAAEASQQASRADVDVKTATLGQAEKDWTRAQTLFDSVPKGIAQAEYDQYFATVTAAKANLELSKANLELSKANVLLQKANVKTAQTNLDYSTISAPVSGVVIDRRVNVGQTVVASLSAPSLFLIAKDLSQMEIWATVNEVDVGKIHAGQDVKFTVDAFPGKVNHGKVVPQGNLPFRLNATMNQNVVTYTVVVSVDNKDGKLSPYMTTNLTFIVADKKNALLVPNAALRWQPSRDQIALDQRDSYLQQKGKKRSPTDAESQDQGFVWIKDDNGHVRYIQLQTGLSDSVNTEIIGVVGGDDFPEGTQVIVGEGRAAVGSTGTNPFVATPFGQKKQ